MKKGGEISLFHWRLIFLVSLTLCATQLKYKPNLLLNKSRANIWNIRFKVFLRPVSDIQHRRFYLLLDLGVLCANVRSNSLSFVNWELMYSVESRVQQLMRKDNSIFPFSAHSSVTSVASHTPTQLHQRTVFSYMQTQIFYQKKSWTVFCWIWMVFLWSPRREGWCSRPWSGCEMGFFF